MFYLGLKSRTERVGVQLDPGWMERSEGSLGRVEDDRRSVYPEKTGVLE